jgi:exopolysaccharide biosynthesis protein
MVIKLDWMLASRERKCFAFFCIQVTFISSAPHLQTIQVRLKTSTLTQSSTLLIVMYSRAEWFLSWSQISKMAGSRSNDISPNRIYPKFQVIWTTFDPTRKALKLEMESLHEKWIELFH